jgi:hypothetical protein
MRALTLFDLLISKPLRWLTGKGRTLTAWSPYCLSKCLDIVRATLLLAAQDGLTLLDPDLDVFKDVAEGTADIPAQAAFVAWRKHKTTKMVKTANKMGEFNPWTFALKRAQFPGEQEHANTIKMTVKLIEVRSLYVHSSHVHSLHVHYMYTPYMYTPGDQHCDALQAARPQACAG